MVEPNNIQSICRNGHQQANADSKFCIYCGTPVSIQQILPAVPNPPQFTPPVPNPPQQFTPPNNPNAVPPNYYTQPQPNQFVAPVLQTILCTVCGGEGQHLGAEKSVCPECAWLRPLTAGYKMDPKIFQWAEDGKAMSALRAVKPLNAAAQGISHKVGRRWIEATFNGVLLSEKQLPEIYAQAVTAARILGMSHMPDVYISGDHMWDCYTYGTDKDSFIVMGTALATNFRGEELVFLFAREMGHCRAGHALWKTVLRFLVGEQTQHKGLMANGIFSALSLTAIVEGALEMPLLAWARQSEITADRAGLIAIGDEEIARRVLLTWSLKSAFLYKQINIQSWLEQQSASDDGYTKLSELATSSTPYITRRLKLMEQFAAHPDLKRWNAAIQPFLPEPAPTAPAANQPLISTPKPAPSAPPKNNDEIKMKCAFCNFPMRVPSKVLAAKDQIAIRCPSEKCGKVTRLKKKTNSATATKTAIVPQQPSQIERNSNYDE